MAKPPSIGLNITSNYLSSFVTLGIALIMTPIMVKHLGVTLYGIWVTIHLIIFYINFIDLGLYDAVVKYVAEYHAKGDHQEVNRIIQSSLFLYLLFGVAASLLCILASSIGELIFKIPPEHIPDLKTCLILFGVELAIAFPAVIYDAILEGHQRFDILGLTSIIFQIAGALTTAVLVFMGFGLKALILNEILFTILGVLADVVIVKIVIPDITIKPGYHKQSLKTLFGFSLWAFLLDLFQEGGAEVEKIIIPILFPVALLTPYSIAVTLASILILGVQPIIDVLFPLSSSLKAQDDIAALQRHATNGAKAASAISMPVILIFILFGQPLIATMFSQVNAEMAHTLLLIISSSYYSTCLLACPVSILVGIGKFKKLLYFSVIEGMVMLVVIFLLYSTFGIYSIALGFAVANILTNFALVLPHITNILNLNLLHFISNAFVKPLVPALCVLLVLTGYNLFFDTGSVLMLVWHCILVVMLYSGLFLFLSNSASERALLYKSCSSLILHAKVILRGSSHV